MRARYSMHARAADLAKVARRPAVGYQLHFRHFRIAEDRPDDVVKVVRDAAGESTDGFHAAGLLQVSLQARAFLLEVFSSQGVGDGIESHAQ